MPLKIENSSINITTSPSDATAKAVKALAQASEAHAKALHALAEALKPSSGNTTGIIFNEAKV